MGTYYIPRNVKGEGRILFIFTGKSLIYTAIGAAVGFPIYFILSNILEIGIYGVIVMGICALIGFAIGTLKIPQISILRGCKDIAGENIDEIVKRYFKFRKKKNTIYINKEKEEVNKNGQSDRAI